MDVSKAEEKKTIKHRLHSSFWIFIEKMCQNAFMPLFYYNIHSIYEIVFWTQCEIPSSRTISTNYQDISIFFSFNSNSILLTEQWKWEGKKHTIFFQLHCFDFPPKSVTFLHLTVFVKSWHLCNTNCSILKTETIEIIAAGAVLGN